MFRVRRLFPLLVLAPALCAFGPAEGPPVSGGEGGSTEEAPSPVTPAPVPPRPQVPERSHLDLEELYTEGDFDAGLELARARLAANPDDVELHWHVARFMYEIGERYRKDDVVSMDKEAWYAEMLAISDRGLALAPGHPHLLFGKGIALGRLGTTRGIVASIRYADDIEAAWMAAASSSYTYTSLGREEILPCDPYMALGTFYRMVPDMWVVKILTGTRGDLHKSVEWIERADRCSPGRIEIRKELAAARICLGQREDNPGLVRQGVAQLREVAAMPPTKPTDRIDVRHAAMLADDPDLACAYSRDGQAEIDADQLEAAGASSAP